MRFWIPAVAAMSMLASIAHAQTPIQAGLWDKSAKATPGGKAASSRSQKICVKADEASLERLALITSDEATARGCDVSVSAAGPGLVRMSMSCPASEAEPKVGATMELRFTPTSFEGTGTVEMKYADGRNEKSTSALSGRRIGDC